MARFRPLIPLLSVLWTLPLAPTASAAKLPGGQNGQFGITPARRSVVGSPGTALTPTDVFNGTDTPYQVSVFPALLTQDLTGAFVFSESPLNLNNSKIVLSVSPSSFLLAPNSRQTVHLQWGGLPVNQRWAAIGIVFQGVAEGQSGRVHITSRLLSVNFLREPGTYNVDGIFTGLFPEQFGPRTLRFVARVKNIGDIFSSPTAGSLTIRDSGGHVALSEPWVGSVVLPGASVDFNIPVTKILQAGRYTATVSMNFGGNRSKTVPFTLVGPNQLPTPSISIQGFAATGTIGSSAHITAKVISSGTAPANVTLHLFLGTANEVAGQQALATDTVAYRGLPAGSTTQLSRSLGGSLKAGSYKAILTWTDPTGAPHQLESDFTAAASKSTLTKIWDWIKNHWWLFLILLILALLAALAYLYNKQRQRQRQLEAELAAARTRGQEPGGGDDPGQPPARGPPAEPSPPWQPAAPPAGPAPSTQPAEPAGQAPPAPPRAPAPPPPPPAQQPPPAPPQPQSAPPRQPTPPPPPPRPAPTARDALNQLRRRARRRFASTPPRPPARPPAQPPAPPAQQPPSPAEPQPPASLEPPGPSPSPWEPPPGS